MPRNPALPLLAPVAGFVSLALFSLLYVFDRDLYFSILRHIGFSPFLHPFVDGEYILSGVECWKKNVNVYIENPCDVLNRANAYSPLWLRATFLPTDRSWVNPLGLGLAIAFLGSLFLLPRAKSGFEAIVLTLATVSTMTTFAVERANIDLVMFLLSILAALGFVRGRWARGPAYGAVLLAGFLKFYPLVLFVFSLAEKPGRFLLINLLGASAFACFVWWFLPELAEMAANIPRGSYFADAFGAVNLPYGLCQVFFELSGFDPNHPWARFLPQLLMILLVAEAARRAAKMLERNEFDLLLGKLPEWDRTLLVTGSALICGCFFAGQSIEYRGIHFLLILPGLLALARNGHDPWLRRLCLRSAMMIVFLMWGEGLRLLIPLTADHLGLSKPLADAVELGFRFLRELVWWLLVSRFGAILAWFVGTSATGRFALRTVVQVKRG